MSSSITTSSTKSGSTCGESDSDQLRRGPWTLEEDTLLIHYIARHGEGRWNLLAKRSGLKRTGKSCRLRWLNYLKPDVKRGNFTPQEQISILELHSKWGNRWSKIAQHLPGRTDNEIKNYWRTRVQKQARHLKIDANSTAFQEVIRCFWMPRLLQKIQGSSDSYTQNSTTLPDHHQSYNHTFQHSASAVLPIAPQVPAQDPIYTTFKELKISESMNNISQISQFQDYPTSPLNFSKEFCNVDQNSNCYDMETVNLQTTMPAGLVGFDNPIVRGCHMEENYWVESDLADNMWNNNNNNMNELWQFRNLQESWGA
ncbi:hypothetical protein Ddye_015370 [Dipteronia dyeriana]|uniref:Uncharacterized protein n=1 Tax=Dipteronia dyeriana TaxID=168575 RepID=A0AAD9WYF4_9ROSI|nr:hypothetical protein Ddye_015370 [Dipteronia dyeriana]